MVLAKVVDSFSRRIDFSLITSSLGGVRSIAVRVSVCLSVSSYISKITVKTKQNFMYMLPLVLTMMLCTSGFVDNVMSSHDGLSGA